MYDDSSSGWGHRNNILGYEGGAGYGNFDWAGIGYLASPGSRYTYYYVNDFMQDGGGGARYSPPTTTDTSPPSLSPPTYNGTTAGVTNVQDTDAPAGAANVTGVVFYVDSVTDTGANDGTYDTVPAKQGPTGTWTAAISAPAGRTLHAVAVDGSGNYIDCTSTACGSGSRASLTITADNQQMTYGGAMPTLTWHANFANGDSAASLTQQPVCSTVPATSNAGAYAIACSGAADPNYNISYASGTLTIDPVNLTVIADDQQMSYGGTMPALTWSANFVNGDTASSLSAQPTCVTVAKQGSSVANYPITCSGAADSNYTIGYTAGDLQVTPASLTITPQSAVAVHGHLRPALTWSANFANGDSAGSLSQQPACVSTAQVDGSDAITSPAATYPITCSGAQDPNYTISEGSGVLTVKLEPVHLTYTGDHTLYRGKLARLSASMTSDLAKPVAGRSITVTLGSGASKQTCSGIANVNGVVSCTIKVNVAQGNRAVTLTFVGDGHGANYDFAPARTTTVVTVKA